MATTIPEGDPLAPTSKTTTAEGVAAIPTSKTVDTEGVPATPASKTTDTEGAPSAPTSKTTDAEGSPVAPTSKAVDAEGSAVAPTSKTVVAESAMPRALQPLVAMDFASNTYNQNGNPVLFDDLFTYTRNSSASFMNRRIVNNKYEYFLDTDYVGDVENLLTYSEQFDHADWTKNSATVSANDKPSPTGDITSDLLSQTGTAGIGYVRQTVSMSANTNYNISVFVKRKTVGATFKLGLFSTSSGVDESSSITPTNEWVRYNHTFNTGADVTVTYAYPLRGENGSTDDFYIWGAQLTEGAKPLPYVKSISSATTQTFTESLRLAYDPETNESLGALIEGSSTNLIIRSEEFDNAAWNKVNATVTPNNAKSPDGTYSADLFVADNALVGNITDFAGGVVASEVYSVSIYAKAGSANEIEFRADIDGVFDALIVDLNDGSVLSADAGMNEKVEHVGDGWYRLSFSGTANDTGFNVSVRSSGNGDGSSGFYIWGAQVEQGVMTSYIRTEGSSVTRAQDFLTILQSGNIKDGDITMFADFGVNQNDNVNFQYAINATSNSGGLYITQNSTNDFLRFRRQDSSSNSTLEMIGGVTYKAVMVGNFSSNLMVGYVDGVEVMSDIDMGSPPDLDGDVLTLGCFDNTSGGLNGNIKNISIYDYAMTIQEVKLL